MKPYIRAALKHLISISGDRIQSNAVMFKECSNPYIIAINSNSLAKYLEKGLDMGTLMG